MTFAAISSFLSSLYYRYGQTWFTAESKNRKKFSVVLKIASQVTYENSYLKTTTTHIATLFLDHQVLSSGIPNFVLTHSSTQFVRKFFPTMCGLFGARHMNNTAYHPRKNWQVDKYKKMIFARLRYYVAKYQGYQNIILQPLTYAYTSKVHRSIQVSLFGVVLALHPLGAAAFTFPSAVALILSSNVTAGLMRSRLLARLPLMTDKGDDWLIAAQNRCSYD